MKFSFIVDQFALFLEILFIPKVERTGPNNPSFYGMRRIGIRKQSLHVKEYLMVFHISVSSPLISPICIFLMWSGFLKNM